ncbi:MAG: hypothetical protein KGL39_49000 [Patescibacteria group bacterium]|nr:hypothetical protein [Patescibacteria group bacterium]
MRKTVPVEQVLNAANTMLLTPDSTLRLDDVTPEQAFRRGIAALLEVVLHTTDTYGGFRYPASELDDEDGVLRGDYDDTRRQYFHGGRRR